MIVTLSHLIPEQNYAMQLRYRSDDRASEWSEVSTFRSTDGTEVLHFDEVDGWNAVDVRTAKL